MRYAFSASLLSLALVLPHGTARADEFHQWTNQFGTRSALLGGAAVAGVRDTSAVYYNPGALAYLPDTGLSISANAYQLQSVTFEGGAGNGLDLDSSKIDTVPLLLSGTFRLGDTKLGYSVLTKQNGSLQFSQRLALRQDLLYGGPPAVRRDATLAPAFGEQASGSAEDFRGQYVYLSELDEYWAGLSWGTQLTPNFAVGVSNFVALRNQAFSYSISQRAVNQDTLVAAEISGSMAVDAYNLRNVLKLGGAFDYGDYKAGVTVTLPSVSLTGSGTVSSTVNQISNPAFVGFDIVIDSRQEELDTKYRSPLSIALGGDVTFGATTWSAAVEWFDSVDDYKVIDPNPEDVALGLPPGLIDADDILTVYDSQKSIVNWVLAFDHALNDTYRVLGSFRTDHSSFRSNAGQDLYTPSDLDRQFVTLGVTRSTPKSDFSIGLSYGFASDERYRRFANIRPSSENAAPTNDFDLATLFPGPDSTTRADSHLLSLIVGWTYRLE